MVPDYCAIPAGDSGESLLIDCVRNHRSYRILRDWTYPGLLGDRNRFGDHVASADELRRGIEPTVTQVLAQSLRRTQAHTQVPSRALTAGQLHDAPCFATLIRATRLSPLVPVGACSAGHH